MLLCGQMARNGLSPGRFGLALGARLLGWLRRSGGALLERALRVATDDGGWERRFLDGRFAALALRHREQLRESLILASELVEHLSQLLLERGVEIRKSGQLLALLRILPSKRFAFFVRHRKAEIILSFPCRSFSTLSCLTIGDTTRGAQR